MLEIKVWDVQHGNATYIRTPNNRHIAVDLGDNGDKFSPIKHLHAQGRGIGRFDVVVITHPHRDHIDDIGNFYLLEPPVLYTPKHLSDADIRGGNRPSDADIVNQYLATRSAYHYPIGSDNDLAVAANFGGASFQVFAPKKCPLTNLNNHSLVVVASYAGLKMVIPGDNEDDSWKELLEDPSFVSAIRGANVLLAAHHGRDAGYCADLFGKMGQPQLVVISDGRFGDTSATDRYGKQARGWTVYDAAGNADTRRCVTTRCDGHITIKMGWQNPASPSRGNFLNVTTSKTNPPPLARILSPATRALSGY